MLKLTRVTGIADTTRMGAALARPGNDPRTWMSYAIVTAVAVEGDGVIVDVTCQPSLEQLTARVGAEYAGPGFGLYAPIDVDDEVIVSAPSGDPAHGLVVVRRMNSASDPLPQLAVENPADFVLVVKIGSSLRLAVAGGGNVYIVSDGGKVILGSADASRGAARIDDSISVSLSDLQSCLDLRYVQIPIPPPGITPPLITPVNGTISSASDTVVVE